MPILTSQIRFVSIVNWYTLTIACSLFIYTQATGRSALFTASEQGNLEIVKLLVKGGANVDLKDKVHW